MFAVDHNKYSVIYTLRSSAELPHWFVLVDICVYPWPNHCCSSYINSDIAHRLYSWGMCVYTHTHSQHLLVYSVVNINNTLSVILHLLCCREVELFYDNILWHVCLRPLPALRCNVLHCRCSVRCNRSAAMQCVLCIWARELSTVAEIGRSVQRWRMRVFIKATSCYISWDTPPPPQKTPGKKVYFKLSLLVQKAQHV